MKKPAVRLFALALCLIMALPAFSSCSGQKKKSDNTVIIYSSAEDYRNEFVLNMLKEKFPDYDIRLEYYTTGDLAAKLKADGTQTECDFILALASSS